MKHSIQIACLFVVVVCTISSCKKDQDTNALDIGYGYYPEQAGKYIIYDVDSIVKNSFTKKVDTFSFQLKEIVESIYTDNLGRPTQRLERYRRLNSTFPWILTDVWSANRTVTSAEKTEENIKYVRLIFPLELNKKWNGNVFNNIGDWAYTYKELDKSKTIGGKLFDSTLTVIQKDAENLIDKKYYREMYAKNFGLIYKEIIDVHSDSINAKPILLRVTGGLISYKAVYNSSGP